MTTTLKPRHKRLIWIVVGLVVLCTAIALVLNAFRSNLVYFYAPIDIAQGKAPKDRTFRLGGLVTTGSVQRQSDGLTVKFVVTDSVQSIPVTYTGILPDLFKEGKGVVAQGKLGSDGLFRASEVLAKHDENYMPPEAAEALKRAGHPIEGKVFAGKKPVVTQAPEPVKGGAAPADTPSTEVPKSTYP